MLYFRQWLQQFPLDHGFRCKAPVAQRLAQAQQREQRLVHRSEQVYAQVAVVVALLGEALEAVRAAEGRLLGVRAQVHLQLRVEAEALAAQVARKGPRLLRPPGLVGPRAAHQAAPARVQGRRRAQLRQGHQRGQGLGSSTVGRQHRADHQGRAACEGEETLSLLLHTLGLSLRLTAVPFGNKPTESMAGRHALYKR